MIELHHLRGNAARRQQLRSGKNRADHGAVGAKRQITAFSQNRLITDLLIRAVCALGIADGDGAVHLEDRLSKHGFQLRLVGRAQNLHARDLPEVAHVKHAVMRFTVGADQASTINGKDHVQPKQGHVVDHHVVGTL